LKKLGLIGYIVRTVVKCRHVSPPPYKAELGETVAGKFIMDRLGMEENLNHIET
jgi:hypothetical protein